MKENCNKLGKEHDWINDPMFEDGVVIMITNDNPQREIAEEMRQFCVRCGDYRYVPKTE